MIPKPKCLSGAHHREFQKTAQGQPAFVHDFARIRCAKEMADVVNENVLGHTPGQNLDSNACATTRQLPRRVIDPLRMARRELNLRSTPEYHKTGRAEFHQRLTSTRRFFTGHCHGGYRRHRIWHLRCPPTVRSLAGSRQATFAHRMAGVRNVAPKNPWRKMPICRHIEVITATGDHGRRSQNQPQRQTHSERKHPK